MSKIVLKEVIDTFENEDLKELCKEMMKTIPKYWYEVPASSTGKYHPSYAVTEGGLMKHTVALVKIMNSIMEVTPYFDSREKDLLRIAGIMHDSRKSGNQEAYSNNKYTNFDHPLQAAEVVRTFKNKEWDNDEIELIASAIESHMGQWNTDKRSSIVLPKPDNKYQYMLHTADYLASRKYLEVQFENSEPVKIDTYKLTFGKHKGKTLLEIQAEAPDYIEWMKTQDMKEPVKTLIKEL